MGEFTRLADVELQNELSESANVFVETGGEVKRVPSSKIGGSGGDGGGGGGVLIVTLDPTTNALSHTYDEIVEAIKNSHVTFFIDSEGMTNSLPYICTRNGLLLFGNSFPSAYVDEDGFAIDEEFEKIYMYVKPDGTFEQL